MTQPAVTFQVRQLEEYLNTRLFDRAQGRITLTPAGIVALEYAERILDLGFIEGDSHLPSLGSDVCCQDELQVVCAPSHPLARVGRAAPGALTEHAYISREPGSGTREVIERYLEQAGLALDSLQVVMEAGSPEALKGLAATGLGFAIMSRATVGREVHLGELVRIPLAPPLIRHFSVVYPKERFQSRLVSGFVQFSKDRLLAMQTVEADAAAS